MQTNVLIQNCTIEDLKNLIQSSIKEATPPQAKEPSKETSTYLTRLEAAKELGVSLVTIDKWSNAGHLQKYKIGGQIRFKSSELHKSLEQVKNLKYKRA